MQLIISLTNPFARKTRIVMAEKRIECDIVVDAPWKPGNRVSHYNPLGKVPVLVLDDGTALFDSRVIVEYLDSISPVGQVIPDRYGRQQVAVRRWEALADGLIDAAMATYLEHKRLLLQQNLAWATRQQTKIMATLNMLAHDLNAKLWCSGDVFSLADIALGCALGYLDLRFPNIDWRKTHPNLMTHAAKLAERSSFIDTIPLVS